MKKVFVFLLCFTLVSMVTTPLFSAVTSMPSEESVTMFEELHAEKEEPRVTVEEDPIPYEMEEFSSGLHKLRRAESIFFGAIPISALLVVIGTEANRQISNGFNPPPLTNKDLLNRAYYTVGVAAGIALFDFLLGQISESK